MPTTGCSSPTTTRAVKEKRRPPLTTLATRLISTTRSWRSRPVAETLRSRTGIGLRKRLEGQPALAGAIGEGLDVAVVAVAAAVEDGGLGAGGLGPLGQQRAAPAGGVEPRLFGQTGLVPLDRGQGAPGVVVDELGHDAPVGAEDGDARAVGRAADLRADAAAAPEAAGRSGGDGHARLPTFRATYSPS